MDDAKVLLVVAGEAAGVDVDVAGREVLGVLICLLRFIVIGNGV